MKISSQTFRNMDIRLDFGDFENCNFEDCKMVYGGYGPVRMVGNTFIKVSWFFADAAQNTIGFLTVMYHGAGDGGRKLVESTFENIKAGKYIAGAKELSR